MWLELLQFLLINFKRYVYAHMLGNETCPVPLNFFSSICYIHSLTLEMSMQIHTVAVIKRNEYPKLHFWGVSFLCSANLLVGGHICQ